MGKSVSQMVLGQIEKTISIQGNQAKLSMKGSKHANTKTLMAFDRKQSMDKIEKALKRGVKHNNRRPSR